jgi:hypothetical protein
MCQPIPASPNSRTESGVNSRTRRSATKIKSATDGIATVAQPSVVLVAAELLELSTIALNLIEVGR